MKFRVNSRMRSKSSPRCAFHCSPAGVLCAICGFAIPSVALKRFTGSGVLITRCLKYIVNLKENCCVFSFYNIVLKMYRGSRKHGAFILNVIESYIVENPDHSPMVRVFC
jgi:hypothetical protein